MTKLEPLLVVPDCHIPYYDKAAWGLMLRAAKDLNPKHIVIIGDFLDFYSVSDHSKDPHRALNLGKEIAVGLSKLDQLDELGATNKIYCGGNHEDRLGRYLQNKAPELWDFVSVPDLLQLKKRGWKWVPYKDDIQIGKMNFTHDVGVAGRNAVFNCLDTYQHSVVTGHTHRLAYIVEGNAKGEFKLSAQFGWLGDFKSVDYMHKAKVLKNWALGFGIGYVQPKTGVVYMIPVPIVKHTCCVNGKLYDAARS
jgi:UDP-2,3-diacylglucosamine pyrophosphatase LpxH